MDRGMDQDEDDKTPRKKAQEEERKEEGIARSPLERRKSDTPSKDKVTYKTNWHLPSALPALSCFGT